MSTKIMIVGAGKTGTTLAKELARYLDMARKNNLETAQEVCIFDGGRVSRKDTEEGFYLPEDMGFFRGETTAMILSNAYPQLKFNGYADLKPDDQCVYEQISSESYTDNHLIICDCSKGARDQILKQLSVLKTKWDISIFFPCKDGLFYRKIEKDAPSVNLMIQEISNLESLQEPGMAIKLRTAYHICRNLIRILQNQSVEKWLPWDQKDPVCYLSSQRGQLPKSLKEASLPYLGKTADIVCIGAGGTGGNVIKELIPILLKHKGLTLTIVDGDRVEEKNLERQAFNSSDVLSFKSQVLAEKIGNAYPSLKERVSAVSNYVDTVEQMPVTKNYPILIGAVDNHRARQIFVQWFERQKDALWIDSANEFNYGEVVISIRADGKKLSPMRSDIFPEVLTDQSPSASEISCGAVNESAPQHQITNLVAAAIVIAIIEEAFEGKKIQGGIIYFDALANEGVYAKRQPLYTKEVRAYAGI